MITPTQSVISMYFAVIYVFMYLFLLHETTDEISVNQNMIIVIRAECRVFIYLLIAHPFILLYICIIVCVIW